MTELRIGVLTCSDSCAAGADDAAGRALIDLAEARGWLVIAYHVTQGDRESISASLIEMCDAEEADVVFTTGGTALGPRDVAPDATLSIGEREVPGIADAVRQAVASEDPLAPLSRAACAQRGRSLIVNLPAGERAARVGFAAVADYLESASAMMAGQGDG